MISCLIMSWSDTNTTNICWTSSLGSSSKRPIITTERLTITLIVKTSDFNYWWTLLHLFDATSLFSWFMIRVQRPLSFDTVNIYTLLWSCILLTINIFLRIVIDRSTLTCNPHDLLLVSSSFQIRDFILFISLSISVHAFNLWHSITRFKIFFIISTRSINFTVLSLLIHHFLQSRFWFDWSLLFNWLNNWFGLILGNYIWSCWASHLWLNSLCISSISASFTILVS